MSLNRYTYNMDDTLSTMLRPILNELKEKLVGKDAIINWGKYKGRLGRVTHAGLDNRNGVPAVYVMCQPYRQYRNGLETVTDMDPEHLLWDHRDARSFIPVTRVSFVE